MRSLNPPRWWQTGYRDRRKWHDDGQMTPPYSPKAVANEFLKRAGDANKPLTQLELQKLVYMAHGWHLAVTGKPLVNESAEAWKFGPVYGSLYSAFADFGAAPIDRLANDGFEIPEVPEGESLNIIRTTWDSYKSWTPAQLVSDTHRPGSPWHRVFEREGGKDKHRPPIPDSLIHDYFVERGLEAESRRG